MADHGMLPLDQWPERDRRGIVGVFTDIDDTLTTDGAITDDALDALGRLTDAGLRVIAITGRPVGWSLPFARSWPVDAIVPENGAVALVRELAYSPHGEVPVGLRRLYQQDEATRQAHFARMQAVAQRVAGGRLPEQVLQETGLIRIDQPAFLRKFNMKKVTVPRLFVHRVAQAFQQLDITVDRPGVHFQDLRQPFHGAIRRLAQQLDQAKDAIELLLVGHLALGFFSNCLKLTISTHKRNTCSQLFDSPGNGGLWQSPSSLYYLAAKESSSIRTGSIRLRLTRSRCAMKFF